MTVLRRLLAAAGLLLLGALAAFADYRESFQQGIKAIDNRDWPGAVTAFRQAIAEKPTEGERILIYGMRFKVYLPHYYLGLAYFHTGNCDAAMKAWAESERQGVVRDSPEYKTLQADREHCRGQGAREAEVKEQPKPTAAPAAPDLKPAIAEAEAEIRRGESAATALARLKAEPEGARVWQSDPTLRDGESKANRDLSSARSLLAEGKSAGDAARIVQAKDAASRARGEFESLERIAADRRDRLEREARAKESEARAKQAALEKQAKEKEKEAKDRQAALEQQAREREKAAEKKPAALPTAAPKIAAKQQPTIPAPPPPPVERKPPAALLEAASAYFQGEYAKAAAALPSAEFSDPRASAQARLLRGAARFAVFVTGGEKDSKLKDQAAEDIRECLRLDPKIAVSPRDFSPRFVEFFRSTPSVSRKG